MPTSDHKLTYQSWIAMRDRCLRPANKAWSMYGGRGIQICPEWGNFWNFLADMGERPSKHHSIDRIDPDGHYLPSNCRWATVSEQAGNKRKGSGIHVHLKGKTIVEAAKEIGISPHCLKERYLNGDRGERLLRPKKQSANKVVGRRVNTAKIDERAVLEIRQSGESADMLAIKYGVTRGTIYHVRNKRTWAHVQDPMPFYVEAEAGPTPFRGRVTRRDA